MNKDKIEVGDLVTHIAGQGPRLDARAPDEGLGLVIDKIDERLSRVYWFKSGTVLRYARWRLTKLSPTQEEQNE